VLVLAEMEADVLPLDTVVETELADTDVELETESVEDVEVEAEDPPGACTEVAT
jgi:hypothetical protein